MNLTIPDKTVRLFELPTIDTLEALLAQRMPAMPPSTRAKAIKGWVRLMESNSQRWKGGGPILNWQESFLSYANAVWRSERLQT